MRGHDYGQHDRNSERTPLTVDIYAGPRGGVEKTTAPVPQAILRQRGQINARAHQAAKDQRKAEASG